MQNETISNKILALCLCPIYLFIALFAFFIIGLSNVEAKSYRYETPTDINFTSNAFPNSGVVKTCTRANDCWYSNGDFVANYVQYRYKIDDNIENTDTTIANGKYKLNFRARIVALDSINKSNLKFSMYYYPNANNKYAIATCDSGSNYSVTYNNSSDNDVFVDYTCDIFNITNDSAHFSYFVISIGNTPNTLFGTQMSVNLQFLGPGEATNDDVINNQNQNADKIMQNQNENADKIMDSMHEGSLKDDKPVDDSSLNDFENSEGNLINEEGLNNINDIDITLDLDSNNFIWDLVTRILNTHTLVYGLMITMLSLGIIKLVLNR